MRKYLLAVCTAALAVTYLGIGSHLQSVIGDPLGPGAFPAIIGCGLLLSAVVILFETRKPHEAASITPVGGSGIPIVGDGADGRKARSVLIGMAAWTLLYAFVFEPVGYLLATGVYVFGMLAYFNQGRWLMSGIVAVGFAGCAYVMFAYVLGIALPPGFLGT